jgi:hypothetical protein
MSIKCEAVVKSTNLKTISEIPSAEVKLVISLRSFPSISEELARMIGETVNITIASQQASMLDEEEDEKPRSETESQNTQLSIDDCGVVHTPGDDTGLEDDNVIPFPESGETNGEQETEERIDKEIAQENELEIAQMNNPFDLPEGFENEGGGFDETGLDPLMDGNEDEDGQFPGSGDEDGEDN